MERLEPKFILICVFLYLFVSWLAFVLIRYRVLWCRFIFSLFVVVVFVDFFFVLGVFVFLIRCGVHLCVCVSNTLLLLVGGMTLKIIMLCSASFLIF